MTLLFIDRGYCSFRMLALAARANGDFLIRCKAKSFAVASMMLSGTDQEHYPAACFKELHYLRWGIETFYGLLKTRLNLENFTGVSPEAIWQDFFCHGIPYRR